ncbi:hypothetical protein PVAND_012434 [Polypedilum vanderplanki]|uniref:F-box domain-containing protein n=1 Tax=Polypedilum vanderplanki TaxID=319348 RepID=A0A9J6CNE9_POLVA|nr:hypothetical protein PVAND_012434 [Polypedilum vanderplanki]
MVKFEELPCHIIEKILNYAGKPHKNFALVCKSFNDAVCGIDEFQFSVSLDLLSESIFGSIIKSKRKISSVNIYSDSDSKLEAYKMHKLFKVIEAHGKNIKQLHLKFYSKIFMSDWIQIFLNIPNCKDLKIDFPFDTSEPLGTISSIAHNLEMLELVNPPFEENPKYFQMFTSTNTLTHLTLDLAQVNFEYLKKIFKQQPNIKHFKVSFKEITFSYNVVFEKSNLETLKISYENKVFNENVYNLLRNQENLLELQLDEKVEDFNSNAVIPLNVMKKLKRLTLCHNFELRHLIEVGALESLEMLEINDNAFKHSSNTFLELNWPNVTHLKLNSSIFDQYDEEEYPFQMLHGIMPNLRNFELYTCLSEPEDSDFELDHSKRIFVSSCLKKVLIMWPNLESFGMIDIGNDVYDEYFKTVDISCLLEDDRINKNLKVLKLNIPIILNTAQVLKLIYDYPKLEHIEMDVKEAEFQSAATIITYFKLMIKKLKHLKIIKINLFTLVFMLENFNFIIEHGTHMKRIEFTFLDLIDEEEDNDINYDGFFAMLKVYFKNVYFDDYHFILEN